MKLSGHSAAWEEWEGALASERMHHGWILTGLRGLGKGSFARAAAAELVRDFRVAQPDVSQHPDIVILEHLPANTDEEKKKAEGKPFQKKRNITIAQVRAMQRGLTTRPTLGARRAVIIDPVDDMEKGAINALLKSLEEPPAGTFFILVSHQPGRLLPTVRSRCRILRFSPLEADAINQILQEHEPEASISDRIAAIAASEGSPGAALGFVGQGLADVHTIMMRILEEGDPRFTQRGALVQEIGTKPDRVRMQAIFDLARTTLASHLKSSSHERQSRIIQAHSELVRLASLAPTYNFDPGLIVMEIGGLLASAGTLREGAL